jgi:cell division septum initiation protein DivIVA
LVNNSNNGGSSNPASASTSLYLENAEKLAARLAEEKSGEAQRLADEARELASQFFSWKSKKPEGSVRVARIQQLFDLHRRAMDVLGGKQN